MAFSAGASGQGITIADIDSGADPSLPDMSGAISALSVDIVPAGEPQASPGSAVGYDPHGNFVTSVIGARYNGFGTIGVAYDSTILEIRADSCSSGTSANNCNTSSPNDPRVDKNIAFQDSDLAAGIEYAIQHGAKVINLSLGGPSPVGADLQQALADAVNAGIAITVAAGNDSAANPDFPARLAVDPRYAGLMVAVGATDQTGALASFSNMAGSAANGYLAAPGDNLPVDCDQNNVCTIVSGTSFSAPHVAGAIALLMQAFPNLTAAQALNLLFTTADDAGAAGTDAVYGRGVLDLTKAFQPAGSMSVPTSGAGAVTVTGGGDGITAFTAGGVPVSVTGSALGDSLHSSHGLTTVGYDSYHRLFKIDLASAYRAPQARGLIAAPPAQQQTSADFSLPAGARLALASGGPLVAADEARENRILTQTTDPAFAAAQVSVGRLTMVAWRGQGGAQPDLGAPRDAFQAIAAPDQVLAARLGFGRWSVDAEGGLDDQRLAPFASAPVNGSSYVRVGTGYAGAGFSARAAMGSLTEPLGPLGSTLTGGFAIPATTRFLTLGGEKALPDGLTLYGEASLGETRFAGPLLRISSWSMSSSWRIGLTGDCAARWKACSHFGAELAQPLRFETGAMTADLADPPAHYFDPLSFSQRHIAIAPSGRELDLRLFADRDLGAWGFVRLEASAADEEGNIARAPFGLGFIASWRYGF